MSRVSIEIGTNENRISSFSDAAVVVDDDDDASR